MLEVGVTCLVCWERRIEYLLVRCLHANEHMCICWETGCLRIKEATLHVLCCALCSGEPCRAQAHLQHAQ